MYASQMEIALLLVPAEMTEGMTETLNNSIVYKRRDNEISSDGSFVYFPASLCGGVSTLRTEDHTWTILHH